MIKGTEYKLDHVETHLVNFIGTARHQNKIKSGWNGKGTVNENSNVDLNRTGFGGEFILCRELNLMPDFSIGNTSKKQGTDIYDCVYKGKTIDVKVNRKDHHPLMVPEYSKSSVDLFALFSCRYPYYTFEGFATNEQVFQDRNLRMTRVMSYVVDKVDLLNLDDLKL